MKKHNKIEDSLPRRDFMITLAAALGSTAFIATPITAKSENSFIPNATLTVKEIIDIILKEIPGAPFNETVDTLKSGSLDQPVTGIISSSFATVSIIERAVALKANFIIVHEPTFYNHRDDTDWLKGNDVYEYKMSLLEKHKIAVWPFHDYWHSHRPDGVQTGVLEALGWTQYADKTEPHIVTLPSTSLKQLVATVKSKLGIQMVRVIGDSSQPCKRIALLPGAAGGRRQITAINEIKPDLVIVGELSEWETSEYVRDARAMGKNLALIVLGHAVSEEPGMKWLVPWLQPKVPGLTIIHVPAQNPLTFM